MGVPIDPCYHPTSTSCGELLGVEYLYGENVSTLSLDVDKEIDQRYRREETFSTVAKTEGWDPELNIASGSFVNRYVF
jgi:hypothetical protein